MLETEQIFLSKSSDAPLLEPELDSQNITSSKNFESDPIWIQKIVDIMRNLWQNGVVFKKFYTFSLSKGRLLLFSVDLYIFIFS